jgi:hypothetical protein
VQSLGESCRLLASCATVFLPRKQHKRCHTCENRMHGAMLLVKASTVGAAHERNGKQFTRSPAVTASAPHASRAGLPSPDDVRRSWAAAHPAPAYFDTKALQRLLDHDNHEMRAELRAFLADPLFHPKYGLELAEERELALARLKAICPAVPGGKFLSVWDFLKNPRRIFAAHEIVGMADGSLATKMTVQFNLAGGTILKLGTARHHDMLLDKMDCIERVGCFALTELGYGNNAVRSSTPPMHPFATMAKWLVHVMGTSDKFLTVSRLDTQYV